MKAFPRRGEVWLVNWNPAQGSEQAGERPALIIQNDIGLEKKWGVVDEKKMAEVDRALRLSLAL